MTIWAIGVSFRITKWGFEGVVLLTMTFHNYTNDDDDHEDQDHDHDERLWALCAVIHICRSE
jgi:hypothetical protein